MMSRLISPKAAMAALVCAGAVVFGALPRAAMAQESEIKPQDWPFAGVFGQYDTAALQRGLQVYVEVCSNCHSLKYLYYRNLGEEGGPSLSDAAVTAVAAGFQVTDGPDESGEMFTRPALPRDHFASPFANDQEARAVNGGALPPDLSVMAQARGIERGTPWWFFDLFTGYQEQGPDYIYAVLTGYKEPPESFVLQSGMNYNTAFPGHQIAMPPPLSEGLVEYTDGTEATVPQMAHDVASFLMWAAEPHLDRRKRFGFEVMIFLVVFAGMLYLTKRKVWSRVEH